MLNIISCTVKSSIKCILSFVFFSGLALVGKWLNDIVATDTWNAKCDKMTAELTTSVHVTGSQCIWGDVKVMSEYCSYQKKGYKLQFFLCHNAWEE